MRNGKVNKDLITEELAARIISEVLGDESYIKELGKIDRNLVQRIFDTIIDWIQREINKLWHTGNTRDLNDAVTLFNNEFDTIKALYERALGVAERMQTDKGKGADVGGVMYNKNNIYDYTKSFAEQLDDFDNIPENDSLLVGRTPEVFVKIGFNALPVTINRTHVDYALNGTKDVDHHLGKKLLEQLPQALEKPIAIIHSQTKPNRVVAILKMVHNGKSVVCPVEIDGYAKQNNVRFDSNAITSILGKTNAITKQLIYAINNEVNGNTRLFYWNKKEALSLLQRAGHQLPGGLPQDGFVHSITENGSPVNKRFDNVTYSQQFIRWFGNWIKNPKKASKVVNPDGTPKIMYRGGGEDIRVFDRKKSRASNLYGRGFYFTDSEAHAKQYGEARAYYLNIKNPLKPNENKITKEQLRAFLEAVSENEDYDIWNYGTTDIDEILNIVYGRGDFEALQDINATAIGDLVEAIELFNEVNGTKYDGIILPTETVVFRSNQIKSVVNVGTFDGENDDVYYSKSPTAPNISDIEPPDFESMADMALPSLKLKEEVQKKIDAYVEKYGEMEKGSMPARDVVVPKKTSEKTYVRRNTRTIAEAEAITDEKASVLLEEVANDESWTTYERFGDKQAIDSAVTEFERLGYDAALRRWRAIYESNKRITKQNIADVHLLIQEAAKRNDTKTFIELVSNSAEIGTMAGQVVQAMFLIKRMGPAAQINALERNIKNAEEEINKKFNKSDFEFDVPQEMIDEYNEALLEEERQEKEAEKEGREIDRSKKKESDRILDKIYDHMSKQVPMTWQDKFTTWRYFAMLGNPRTHIRNVVGNATFMPVIMMKNIVAAVGEDSVSLIASVAGKNMERTKSIRSILTIGKYWKFAGNDAKGIEDILSGEAKYGEDRKHRIQPKQFKHSAILGK